MSDTEKVTCLSKCYVSLPTGVLNSSHSELRRDRSESRTHALTKKLFTFNPEKKVNLFWMEVLSAKSRCFINTGLTMRRNKKNVFFKCMFCTSSITQRWNLNSLLLIYISWFSCIKTSCGLIQLKTRVSTTHNTRQLNFMSIASPTREERDTENIK